MASAVKKATMTRKASKPTKTKRTQAKRKPSAARVSPATAYKPEYCAAAKKLCELGATDSDLAEAFEVNRSTIFRWRVAEPDFSEACQIGKEVANKRVERSLFERANGYTYDAVKIFLPKDSRKPVYAPYREHVPPSEVACFFWLTNRDKENWQHRHQLEHTGKNGGPIRTITAMMTLTEMAALYARTVADPDAVIESDEAPPVALLE